MSELPGQIEPIVDGEGKATPIWYQYFLGAAWTRYTPVITTGAGTITSVSASGRYRKTGRTVFVTIDITITTNGTGSSSVAATLPAVAGPAAAIAVGRETAVGGKMLQGLIGASGQSMVILNYDNTYPGGNGYRLIMSGVYEAAK